MVVVGTFQHRFLFVSGRGLKSAGSTGGGAGFTPFKVAVFAQNIPAFRELHFSIPMAGAVICALNSRLDAGMASVLLQHSEAKVAFNEYEALITSTTSTRP
ncbi:putative acyl-activating enzyme 1, peroxisomal [Panicum miliaceum]|uniref:Acyl-activating enzyme 1, peroxisomal n=1 Tax=Panicum miliaceum TaxID=4540 RepID=A0A3L6RY66_PANMI|nr:putative acyl-activating enzyme 1, peroxisomal [Panicum miliaceum]